MSKDFEIRDNRLLRYHGKGGNVIIPDGVTSIGRKVFFECKSLISVTIPDSVTSIGIGAFSGCSSLISVIIPDRVTNIERFAFSGCLSLKSVTIGNSVTSIRYGAFAGCSSLTSVTIDGVTINLSETGNVEINDILFMLIKKDYHMNMNHDVKYNLIFQLFALGVDEERVSAYIKKNFAKMFRYLIDHEKTEIIQKILDSEKFVTKRNIDKHIQYAIDQKKYQSQILLTDYKQQKNWYQDIDKKFKL